LETITGRVLAEGDAVQAMIALGASEAIREVLKLRPWPITQPFVDGLVASADHDPDFQAARAAGRQLSPQAAADLGCA
jgi:hypothetical protein